MGDKVRWPHGQPHGQQQVAKMPQQEYGQGVAGTPQEYQGWVKRLQGQPQATQKQAQVAVTLQEKPQAAIEQQEMRAVAQPPEAKVGGAANPLPKVAELPQLWVGGLDSPPWHASIQCAPPNLQIVHALTAWQPPSPPLRWPHLFLGGLPLPLIPPPRAGEPALHLSWPGAATPPVWWVPYPGPRADTWPSHLVPLTTHPYASHCQHSCRRCWRLFRHRISSRGRLPHVHLCVRLFNIFLHWPLHGPPLLLCLHHIPAWS